MYELDPAFKSLILVLLPLLSFSSNCFVSNSLYSLSSVASIYIKQSVSNHQCYSNFKKTIHITQQIIHFYFNIMPFVIYKCILNMWMLFQQHIRIFTFHLCNLDFSGGTMLVHIRRNYMLFSGCSSQIEYVTYKVVNPFYLCKNSVISHDL